MLRILFLYYPKKDENEEWRRLHNEELHGLYRSPNIIRVIKSRRLRWAGHVARIECRIGDCIKSEVFLELIEYCNVKNFIFILFQAGCECFRDISSEKIQKVILIYCEKEGKVCIRFATLNLADLKTRFCTKYTFNEHLERESRPTEVGYRLHKNLQYENKGDTLFEKKN